MNFQRVSSSPHSLNLKKKENIVQIEDKNPCANIRPNPTVTRITLVRTVTTNEKRKEVILSQIR